MAFKNRKQSHTIDQRDDLNSSSRRATRKQEILFLKDQHSKERREMIDDLKRISEAREIQNTTKVSNESKGIN